MINSLRKSFSLKYHTSENISVGKLCFSRARVYSTTPHSPRFQLSFWVVFCLLSVLVQSVCMRIILTMYLYEFMCVSSTESCCLCVCPLLAECYVSQIALFSNLLFSLCVYSRNQYFCGIRLCFCILYLKYLLFFSENVHFLPILKKSSYTENLQSQTFSNLPPLLRNSILVVEAPQYVRMGPTVHKQKIVHLFINFLLTNKSYVIYPIL